MRWGVHTVSQQFRNLAIWPSTMDGRGTRGCLGDEGRGGGPTGRKRPCGPVPGGEGSHIDPRHDFDSPNLGDSPLPGRLPSQGNRRRHQGYLIKEGVATGGTRSGCSAPRSAQSAGTGPLVRGMARLSWAFWPTRGPYGVAKGARTWLLHCGGVGPSGDWRTSQGLAPVPQRAGREAAVVQCGPGGDQ